MRLVDDLIEPFRPVVDFKVWQLAQAGVYELNAETKHALVRCLYFDMQTEIGISPVGQCIQRLATSLAQIYLGERKTLNLPKVAPILYTQLINKESYDEETEDEENS